MQNISVISINQELLLPTRERRRHSLGDIINRLFGCRHRALSRPFTHDRQTYLSCLDCGMRRDFDLENWKPRGAFYAEVKQ